VYDDTQAGEIDLVDILSMRFGQLYAMALVPPEDDDKALGDYRWALSDLVEETRALFAAYSRQK
jgi:hypothetical protein